MISDCTSPKEPRVSNSERDDCSDEASEEISTWAEATLSANNPAAAAATPPATPNPLEGGDTVWRLILRTLFKEVGRGAGFFGMTFRGLETGRTRGRGREAGALVATLRTAARRVFRWANLFKLVPRRTTLRTTRRGGGDDDLRTVFLVDVLRTGRRPFLIFPGIFSSILFHVFNFDIVKKLCICLNFNVYLVKRPSISTLHYNY